jgi:hypothetical protein
MTLSLSEKIFILFTSNETQQSSHAIILYVYNIVDVVSNLIQHKFFRDIHVNDASLYHIVGHHFHEKLETFFLGLIT